MPFPPTDFLKDETLQLDWLKQISQKPALFEPGEALFWDDPHIAQQMLKFHLDPNTEASSRPPDDIDAIVQWIMKIADLQAGDPLLDLGCGPGLYCKRFAANGLQVMGIDLSQNSINYARQQDDETTYICQNYLTLDYTEQFKTITLIYGDFCVLSDEKRDTLLKRIHRALQPGGIFIFDVTTRVHHQERLAPPSWGILESGGFWKPTLYIVLTQTFDYPEDDTSLDQFIVIEADGTTSVYRNWFHYYSPETIRPILENQGFEVRAVYNGLSDQAPTSDSKWLGIVAGKA